MYRGHYASREQSQTAVRDRDRLRKKDPTRETFSRIPLQHGDVKRKVYLPPVGAIALGLLYQVAR